jgi:aspartyl-tRNA synthetase
VFFIAGKPQQFVKFAGSGATKVGEELGLIAKDRFDFCWIVDFPMFEWNEEDKKIDFSHNPFSMPNMDVAEFLKLDPAADQDKLLAIKAIQYDIVCNGTELSVRRDPQSSPGRDEEGLRHRGLSPRRAGGKFGGMLRALSLGAPPHGGIAPGIDRIVMLLCGEENLREVVLFPMNQRAEDLLMGAPSEVTPKQLRELHIRLNLPTRSSGSAASGRLFHPSQIRRHRLAGQRLERGVERHHLLALLAEPADRDQALGGFLLADHQHHRHLGQRVLADLVVDLLVAQIALGP